MQLGQKGCSESGCGTHLLTNISEYDVRLQFLILNENYDPGREFMPLEY